VAWGINGRARMAHGPEHAFAFTVDRGRTVELAFLNCSSFWHPMHVQGHAFRELSRNGRPISACRGATRRWSRPTRRW
jgi:hypothetical protein